MMKLLLGLVVARDRHESGDSGGILLFYRFHFKVAYKYI